MKMHSKNGNNKDRSGSQSVASDDHDQRIEGKVKRTMTSNLRRILAAIPNKFGGKVAREQEQSNFAMFHQLLPPNTLITVSSSDISNSPTSSGLPTKFTTLGSTMFSPKNKTVVQNPHDNSSMEARQAVTTDKITCPQKQDMHKSFRTVSQKKRFPSSKRNFLRSGESCKFKPFKKEACLTNQLNNLTDKTDDSSNEKGIEKSSNSKSCNNDSETDFFPSSSSSKSSVFHGEVEVTKNTNHGSFAFCFVCNMEFGTSNLLQKHRESKQFFCRVCVVEFSDHDELEIHLKSHRTLKCRTCHAVFFSKKDLFEHKQSNKQCNYRIECEHCKKKFFEERCLKIHMRRYHSDNNESHVCVVCGKTFNTFEMLNYHLKRVHQPYEHLECQICKVLMVGPDRLKQHVKTTHLDAAEGGTYVCTICKNIYSTKSLLRNHMDIHDNSVRLCDICGKSIEGKQPMRRHMAKEHSTRGFVCKICNQQFNSLNELRKHAKHHKKPVDESRFCEICGKKLKNSHTLRIHLQIHSDDKPFKCDDCGACFKQEVTLRTHQRVHSDLGKYICNVCGMSFRWKQTFDKHVKKCGSADQNSSDERFNSQ